MPAIVVVGAQWGDEGKGKATDLLGDRVDYVVRYQGGNNAGHTVVIGDESYALRSSDLWVRSGVTRVRARPPTYSATGWTTSSGTRAATTPVIPSSSVTRATLCALPICGCAVG